MARRNLSVQTLKGFTGGVDYDSSPFDVPQDCLISVSNVLPSLSVGGISQRNGYSKLNSAAIAESSVAKAIVGLFSIVSATVEYLVSQAGTKFYQNTPEGTWADKTGALVLTDSQNNLTSMDVLANIMYFANRQRDAMWKWTLSGNGSTITAPPSGAGKFVIAFNRRLWSFGNAATPLIGDYSDIDVATWTANNNLNFDEGQGDEPTGAVRRGTGAMVVFKSKSVTFVEATGTTPAFTKYLFVDGIGCVSHQSIVTLPGGTIMWWDDNDIFMMVGNQITSATNHPSTGKPRLRNFFRSLVNQSRLQYVCGVYYPDLDIVRWFYTKVGGTSNNAHIDYHVKTKSWWPGTLRGTSTCVRVISGDTRIYAGDTNGFAYRQDTTANDDGSSITMNARIPWQSHEGLTIRKKLDLLAIIAELQGNYGITADIYFDQSITAGIQDLALSVSNISGAEWDVAQFDVDAFVTESSLFESSAPVNRLYKTVSVDIKHTGADEPVTIHALNILERPLETTVGTTQG